MPETSHQRDLLIRYLLGVVSDEERNTVEEQYFADDTGLDVVLRAEDELIDDYVRGALTASDRRLFESHFLCTKGRRQRLETVESLVEALALTESGSSERLSRSLPFERREASRQRATSYNQLALALDQAGFDKFLHWLDSDRQRAGEKYENIRRRLIKFFGLRGFDNAEDLADETVDRVVSRMAQLSESYIGDPASYFYAVAKLVTQQGFRQQGFRQPASNLIPVETMGNESVSDPAYSCLEKCLKRLSESNRDLILHYYVIEKEKKINSRKQLAQSLGIPLNALRLRVHTIRRTLENCVKSCLQAEDDR